MAVPGGPPGWPARAGSTQSACPCRFSLDETAEVTGPVPENARPRRWKSGGGNWISDQARSIIQEEQSEILPDADLSDDASVPSHQAPFWLLSLRMIQLSHAR